MVKGAICTTIARRGAYIPGVKAVKAHFFRRTPPNSFLACGVLVESHAKTTRALEIFTGLVSADAGATNPGQLNFAHNCVQGQMLQEGDEYD
jgi:hypothetical protein